MSGPLVALYLTEVRLRAQAAGVGPSAVLRASAAVASVFEMVGMSSPTSHPMCRTVREVAQRTLAAEKLQRDELLPADVARLVAEYCKPGSSLMDRMHATAIVLMFTGFLRYDDMAKVLVHEDLLRVHDGHLELFIFKSKTDQHWDGVWVLISALPGSPNCPVTLVRQLLAAGDYQTKCAGPGEDLGPLLRAVLAVPGGHKLKQRTAALPQVIKPLTASRLRDRLQAMCKAVGIDKAVGLHSCRIGGASAAANNHVDDRLFQKHGRWASATVKNGYVREQLEERLRVSRELGL
jgi:hypothetical protein